MKKFILFLCVTLVAVAFNGCDKVEKPYPPVYKTDLDTTLYPGLWSNYLANEMPVFTANTNTNRNVLIEDFTGHKCNNCPLAADLAHESEHENPGRVFVTAIHSSEKGKTNFQEVDADYPTDWTNPNGLEVGIYFGSIPGSSFTGNPSGMVNRVNVNNQNCVPPNQWKSRAKGFITANKLPVNIQAKLNYFDETRGLFLHAEVDPIDAIADPLKLVVYVIEDSIIGDQKMPDNTHNHAYVHRNVMRGCLDGKAFGRELTEAIKTEAGNYRLDYSYKLPAQYNPENMHLLLFVINTKTNEIQQVIEKRLVE